MDKIVIIGAGGLAREVLWVLSKQPGKMNFIGFIDENESNHGQLINGFPVLGGFEWLNNVAKDDLHAVCAVGSPRSKKILTNRLKSKGVGLITLIDPDARYSDTVTIGQGSIVAAGAILTDNILVGNSSYINLGCTIGHDVVIGDYVSLHPQVAISGNVKIGDLVEIGAGAVVTPGINIGDNSFICAGSVVTKDVEKDSMVGGMPARFIRRIDG